MSNLDGLGWMHLFLGMGWDGVGRVGDVGFWLSFNYWMDDQQISCGMMGSVVIRWARGVCVWLSKRRYVLEWQVGMWGCDWVLTIGRMINKSHVRWGVWYQSGLKICVFSSFKKRWNRVTKLFASYALVDHVTDMVWCLWDLQIKNDFAYDGIVQKITGFALLPCNKSCIKPDLQRTSLLANIFPWQISIPYIRPIPQTEAQNSCHFSPTQLP